MELHKCCILLFALRVGDVSSFIIPNEFPTILSLVYSNIPPIKLGADTRFGIGFRLGPHADFQTLVEIGPQTSTGQIAPDAPAKRDSPPVQQTAAGSQAQPISAPKQPLDTEADNQPLDIEADKKEKKAPPKKTSPFMEKIVFKKVAGIDDR